MQGMDDSDRISSKRRAVLLGPPVRSESAHLESWRASKARSADHAAQNAPEAVKQLYRIMQKQEKVLGGGEGLIGIYGTITLNGMHAIIQSLKSNCGLSHDSSLVDVGAGLARPLLHSLVDPGVSGAWGIELDSIKCNKANVLINRTSKEVESKGAGALQTLPRITCLPVEKVDTFHPYSHAFSFWEGVPQNGKYAFGRIFRKTDSMLVSFNDLARVAEGVAVVQRAFRKDPAAEMRKMGFGIVYLVDTIRVKMSGSGRSFVAYIFKKPEHPPPSVLELLAGERLQAQEIGKSMSKRRKIVVDKPNGSPPISHGTRSRKKIDWVRRRDIRRIENDT